MDFSLRKSFNYKQKHVTGESSVRSPEKRPILHDHDSGDGPPSPNHQDQPFMSADRPPNWKEKKTTTNNQDVTWKNNSSNESFDFLTSKGAKATDDPPTKQKQNKNDTGEIALDVDSDMDELSHTRINSSSTAAAISNPLGSRELRVSFDFPIQSTPSSASETDLMAPATSSNTNVHTNTNNVNTTVEDRVLRCSSNASIQRKSMLLSRVKTRSRLHDPSPEEEQMLSGWIGKSGQLKSGMIAKAMEDDEDDPLAGEDVPDEFKRAKLNALTLLQWISLIVIVASLICSLSIRFLKQKTMWQLHLWKWEVFLLVLICGRLVSGWGIRLMVFFIERNFLLRKKVLYFVYGLRKAVQNCLWLGLVVLAWHFLFDQKVQNVADSHVLPYLTKVLICFLVATFLWLIKTLMVKVLASSFHVSTYFDRIQDSVFNQYIIETLSGPPMIELQRMGEEEERTQEEIFKLQNAGARMPPELSAAMFPPMGKSGGIIGRGGFDKSSRKSIKLPESVSKKSGDDGITIDHLHKLNHKNVSAWNMKRLMKIVKHASLSTLDEQIVENSGEDESTRQIRSEYEAKAAARKIFKNVARAESKFIYLEDLMRFLSDDEAAKTMSLFEGASESKRISKSSLKNWLVNAFRERRALALTLNDTKTAVNRLHHMVNFIAATLILVIWLLILEIATSKFLVFVSSQLVLVAFIFGNTCKTVFESIIFLFVMHPYDVGDRCEIDGVQLVVEEMNILTTVFLRYDSLKILYPNSILWQKPISNFYRSPDMGDAVEFCVHISTPAEKIALIRQKITSFIDGKSEHWYPSAKIVVKDMEQFTAVRIAIWPCHRINHQDMGERWTRRSYLVEELVKILKELDMQYRLLPLDINVKAMPMPLIESSRMPPGWPQNPT